MGKSEHTGRRAASAAAKTLASKSASRTAKSAGASALTQRKSTEHRKEGSERCWQDPGLEDSHQERQVSSRQRSDSAIEQA